MNSEFPFQVTNTLFFFKVFNSNFNPQTTSAHNDWIDYLPLEDTIVGKI